MDFRKKRKVLKLKKTLYGMRQSKRDYWKVQTKKMKECGMKQTQLQPWLFVGEKVICICYVDDFILWWKNDSEIDEIENFMIGVGVYLKEEGYYADFIGSRIELVGDNGKLKKKHLLIK